MALSVSGFPEPSRHPNEAFTNPDEANTRSVGNTPRLLGFFAGAASASTGKKPELGLPATTTATRAGDGDLPASRGSSAPTTPATSFPGFEILPQKEYEKELSLGVVQKLDPPRGHNGAKRARLPSLPRRTTPSPVRLGPSNMTRFETGAGPRNRPQAHVHSKSIPAPVVVVQDWCPEETPSSSRPLPCLPPAGMDPLSSSKSGANAVVVSSLRQPTGPSTTHASAVAGPSKQPHVNNKQAAIPRAVTPPSSKVLITQSSQRAHKQNSSSLSMRYQPLIVDPSPSLDASSTVNDTPSNPVTTVLLAPNPIRPLPRIPPSSSILRPPPSGSSTSTSSMSRYTPPPAPVRRPRTSPSSSSSFTSFSAGPSTSSSATSPRSAFENIPSSWASKPVDLKSSRPNSPPVGVAGLLRTTTALRHRPTPLKMPRSRSYSRPRRERSADSYVRLVGHSRTPPGSARLPPTSFTDDGLMRGSTAARLKTSQTVMVTGARPLMRKCSVMPTVPNGSAGQENVTAVADKVLSPGLSRGLTTVGDKLPSPPLLSRELSPSTRMVSTFSRTVKPAAQSPPRGYTPSPSQTQTKTSPPMPPPRAKPISRPTGQTIDTPSHPPLDATPLSKAVTGDIDTTVGQSKDDNPESPLEYFIDGPETDIPRPNRSPSPIQYARPPSDVVPGNWQYLSTEGETTDDEPTGASSSTSNSPKFVNRSKRRRGQLRSYKMDYRPQVQNLSAGMLPIDNPEENLLPRPSTETLTFIPPPSRAARKALTSKVTSKEKEKKKEKEERKKKEKWTFADFSPSIGASSSSPPETRQSSPERKGRSRQPRKLADAVSLALGSSGWSTTVAGLAYASGRGATSGPVSRSRLNTSSSGELDEVLDIRMPPLSRSNMVFDLRRGGGPSPLEFDPERMVERPSTRSSSSPKVMITARSREEMAETSSNYASESSLSVGGGSGRGGRTSIEEMVFSKPPASEEDEGTEEMPFMWLSRDKPPLKSTPVIPPPSASDSRFHRTHSRVGSLDASSPQQSQVVVVSGSSRDPSRNRSVTRRISPVASASTGSMSPVSSLVSTPLTSFARSSSQPESADYLVGVFLGSDSKHGSGPRFGEDLEGRNVFESAGKPKEQLRERGEVNSRRVVEHGEYWEGNRRAQVVDVIPKLRALKADK